MKIETKFNVGDTAYYIYQGKPLKTIIKSIFINVNVKLQIGYTTDSKSDFNESSLFKSKKDLLAHIEKMFDSLDAEEKEDE